MRRQGGVERGRVKKEEEVGQETEAETEATNERDRDVEEYIEWMEQEHEEEMTQRIKERKEKQRFQGKDSHKYMWKCPICPNWETGTVTEELPPKQRKKKVIALKMKHVKQCHPGQEKELRMRM
eukprot:334515-Karenia_brevis.AAC.1